MKTQQLSANRMQLFAKQLYQVNSNKDLCDLLAVSKKTLWRLTNQPVYKAFYVSKAKGGQRYIEDPCEDLKNVQRILNESLQCVYYQNKTDAAYGFLLTIKDEEKPRNIYSNAEKHLNKKWLLNIDFKDFFHSIKSVNIETAFVADPIGFKPALAKTLTKLTTYNGRLPMGAPTSPVMSNFDSLNLDYDLLDFARQNDITYTRFADDLSFSSNKLIDDLVYNKIKKISESYSYIINPKKTKLYTPTDTKYVTGLRVGHKVDLPEEYYQKLQAEIQRYKQIMEVQINMGCKQTEWVVKYQKQLIGSITFAGFVLGKHSTEYQILVDAYDRARQPIFDNYDSVSWLDFNYN